MRLRPRGLDTAAGRGARAVAEIPDYDRAGAAFLSHQAQDLGRARVAALQGAGADVLCWTIRSPQDEAKARRVAQNITFEGTCPRFPLEPGRAGHRLKGMISRTNERP